MQRNASIFLLSRDKIRPIGQIWSSECREMQAFFAEPTLEAREKEVYFSFFSLQEGGKLEVNATK